jgi:hypothetical protein
MGLLFAILSWYEGLTAFLPDRTALANCAFFLRRSNSVGYEGTFRQLIQGCQFQLTIALEVLKNKRT